MSDELREAEYWGRMKGRHDGGSPEAVVLMREYDRRAGLLLAYDTATSRLEAEVERLAADLARALPVVEAAGELVSLIDVEMFHHDQSDCRCPARFDQGKHEEYCAANPCGSECFRCVLDALASAVNGGEQG